MNLNQVSTVLYAFESIIHFYCICFVSIDLDWFNTTKPLLFSKHLKGKLVLLDFFTYCCVNCLHILPVLHRLQQRFSCQDGLVIVSTIFELFKIQ